MLVNKLKQIYLSESFNPGLVGVFCNPFYFARKGLYKNIRELIIKLYGRVLDVGCGQKPYMSLCNCSEYIGLEIDNVENKKNKKADYFYNDQKMPFEDKILSPSYFL